MKQIIIFCLLLTSVAVRGQYNPSTATVTNKPLGIAQAVPTDARSYYYDASLFIWRPYQSTAEVLSYLNLTKYRIGQFPIFVNEGGSLQSNGSFVGGVIKEYWFKDGTSNASLILKTVSQYTDSLARAAVGGSYMAKWFGILGNGTDQTTLVNSTLSSLPVGSTLEFEPNITYNAASKIIIPKSVRLLFNNATINYTGTGIAISIQSSNVEIAGMRFTGQASSYVAFAEAITTEGNSNSSFYDNINIHDCYISNYRSGGIVLKYVTNYKVNHNTITDMGYAGVMVISGTFGDISTNQIKRINIDNSSPTGDAYGIVITKYQSQFSDTISHDVTIALNQIDSVTYWHGIDTHGGRNVVVNGNTVNNCRDGIYLTYQQNSASDYSSPIFTINGNIINNENISLANVAGKSAIQVNGDVTIKAHGSVTGNTCYGGGLLLSNTEGVVVGSNTFIRPYTFGLLQNGNNYKTNISNNTFIDTWRPGGFDCAAIWQNTSKNNTAFIEGNVLIRGSMDTAGGFAINKYGFLNTGDTTNRVNFGINDFTGTSVISNRYANNTDQTISSGTVSPTMAQPTGSIYINRTGTYENTFYVRENSAWTSFLSQNHRFGYTNNFFVGEDSNTHAGWGMILQGYNPTFTVNGVYNGVSDGQGFAVSAIKGGAGIYHTGITNLLDIGFYGIKHYPTPSTVIYSYIGSGSDADYTNNNIRLYQNKNAGFPGSVAIGIGQGLVYNMNSSAVLQLDGNDKGFLPPRMTSAEGNAIVSPAFGLLYANRTRQTLMMYDTSKTVKWRRILSGDTTILISGMQPIANATGDFAMAIPTGTTGVIVTPSSGGLNYKADTALMATNAQLQHRLDSLSATLIKTGIAFFSGDGSTTTFDITLPTTPTWANAEASSAAGANITYRTPITNGIRIFYAVAPASGSNNISISYQYR